MCTCFDGVRSGPLYPSSKEQRDRQPDEFSRRQSQMDQAKQTFVELAPLISNFYKGLRKDPEISRLEAIALTGAAFWGLAQERKDDK